MDLGAIEKRLRRWLRGQYEVKLFELDSDPIGYGLYRPTDPDQEEAGGIYLRQFFIARTPPARSRNPGEFDCSWRKSSLDAVWCWRNSAPTRAGAHWQSLGMRVYCVTFELLPDAAAQLPRSNRTPDLE